MDNGISSEQCDANSLCTSHRVYILIVCWAEFQANGRQSARYKCEHSSLNATSRRCMSSVGLSLAREHCPHMVSGSNHLSVSERSLSSRRTRAGVVKTSFPLTPSSHPAGSSPFQLPPRVRSWPSAALQLSNRIYQRMRPLQRASLSTPQ